MNTWNGPGDGPDPYVFGRRPARGYRARAREADAYARAYLGHGDQLAALEAEAARDARRPLTAGEWIRSLARLFGAWSDDGGR